ncbi:hypothetical protein K456DRAFT_29758 [Colletotrichum gloeosporioides 23]|nr:hypothetical protein K456DRAFT_29758 [Colletotrichum gloeosporioides 23]
MSRRRESPSGGAVKRRDAYRVAKWSAIPHLLLQLLRLLTLLIKCVGTRPRPVSLACSTSGSLVLGARASNRPSPAPHGANDGGVAPRTMQPWSCHVFRIPPLVSVTRNRSPLWRAPTIFSPRLSACPPYGYPSFDSRAPTRDCQMQDQVQIAAPDWAAPLTSSFSGEELRTLPESAPPLKIVDFYTRSSAIVTVRVLCVHSLAQDSSSPTPHPDHHDDMPHEL